MQTVDFLPFATAADANVETQIDYAAETSTTKGFSAGIAESSKLNKVWRQSSVIAAAVANFIANALAEDVLDDGDVTTLIANLTSAVERVGGSGPWISKGNLGATPAFDLSTGNKFTGIATANFTLPNPTNATPGQQGYIEIFQDATGGRTITYGTDWIAASAVRPALSTAANARDLISYLVADDGKIYFSLSRGAA